MYKIFAIIGELGVGKQDIVKTMSETYPSLFYSIPFYSTTKIFQGEEIDSKELADKIIHGDALTVFSNFYGFRASFWEDLKDDKINIGVFSPATVLQMSNEPLIELSIFYVSAKMNVQLVNLSKWEG